MNPDVVTAIVDIQNQAIRSQSSHFHERADLALDDLVRHPLRTGRPSHLKRNALSNALKAMRRREKIINLVSEASVNFDEKSDPSLSRRDTGDYLKVEIEDFLDRARLKPQLHNPVDSTI